MHRENPAPDCTGRKSRRDREPVALALAAGRTVADAARAAGGSVRAVYNWKRDPAFTARVAALRTELYAVAAGRLADLSGKAADVLGGLLDSGAETVRLQAAKAVLDVGPKIREAADLGEQVADLWRQLEAVAHGRNAAA